MVHVLAGISAGRVSKDNPKLRTGEQSLEEVLCQISDVNDGLLELG